MSWSYPSPIMVDGEYKSGGLIWTENIAATKADLQALEKEQAGQSYTLDKPTLLGRWHPLYATFANRHGEGFKNGGLNSLAYETQKVQPYDVGSSSYDVMFATKKIWHYDKTGKRVQGIPGKVGEYHQRHGPDGPESYEGPRPGSEAEKVLGDSSYYWDEQHQWYGVVGVHDQIITCAHCGSCL